MERQNVKFGGVFCLSISKGPDGSAGGNVGEIMLFRMALRDSLFPGKNTGTLDLEDLSVLHWMDLKLEL